LRARPTASSCVARLLRRRAVGGLAVGWASYEDWAQRFLTNEDWSAGEATGRKRLLESVIWELAERRWYGEVFLEQMWESDPALPEEPLRAAAACFHAEHDMMWQIAGLGLKGDDVMANLKDAEVRRQIADIILAARDKDIEAAAHLERALSKSGW